MEPEDAHSLLLGLVALPLEYLAVVTRGGEVLGAAVLSSRGLVFSQVADMGVVDAVAEDLAALPMAVPGVNGPPAASLRFAERWTAGGNRRRWAMRVHRADAVISPVGVPGCFREATRADRDVLVAWCAGFAADTGGLDEVDPEAAVDAWLAQPGSTWLWTDGGRPLSMARYGSPTPNSVRISAVYTPGDLRGRGYAGACVAALTKRLLLSEGWRFTTLFTDLANPISNRLYARLGYRPVCDMDHYRFAPSAALRSSNYPDKGNSPAYQRPLKFSW